MDTMKLQASETNHNRINQTSGSNGRVDSNSQLELAKKMEGIEKPQQLFANSVNEAEKKAKELYDILLPKLCRKIVLHEMKKQARSRFVDKKTKETILKIFEICKEETKDFNFIVSSITDENGTRFEKKKALPTISSYATIFRKAKTVLCKIEKLKEIEEEQKAKKLQVIHDYRLLISYFHSMSEQAKQVFAMCPNVVFPIPGTKLNLDFATFLRLNSSKEERKERRKDIRKDIRA